MNYFGTDGMRGTAGVVPITEEYFYDVGKALASALHEHDLGKKVVIGRDTRRSGHGLEMAVKKGLLDGGVDCLMVGVLPTPGVSYVVKKEQAGAGIVISASHNKSEDNGIKIFSSNGEKIDEAFQEKLVGLVDAKDYFGGKVVGVEVDYPGVDEYKNKCLDTTYIKGYEKLKVVVDCANGAASEVAGRVFEKTIDSLVIINNNPNGDNINLDCGSTNVIGLGNKVKEVKADMGIALDGDADRLIMVDSEGQEVDGDDLVYILATHWKKKGKLKNNVVVGTVMTNYGTREKFSEVGIKFIEADVGDKYVHEKMIEHGSVLGGESSGHIICMDQIGCGDGIISALQIIEVIIESGHSLKELNQTNKKYPYLMKNIRIEKGIDIENKNLKNYLIEKNTEFKTDGRILIRKSGTEPVIRVLIEHKDRGVCERTMQQVVDALS